VHVVWEALYNTSFIMYKFSTDGGATWSIDTALTVTPDYWSVSPSATMDGSDVHLIWTDFRDSEYGEIYYKRKLAAGAGAEERVKGEERRERVAASVIRSLPAGAVAFDAMGRRVLNPRPGICFVRSDGRGAEGEGRTYKVLIPR
jgi:hypothetical protein